MFPVWLLTVVLLFFILCFLPVRLVLKYEKHGLSDKLEVTSWILFPSIRFSMSFSILDLEQVKSLEHFLRAFLHTSSPDGIQTVQEDNQAVTESPDDGSVDGDVSKVQQALVKNIIRKYHAISQIVTGLIEGKPGRFSSVHVGSFAKDMFVRTALRTKPTCQRIEWDVQIGLNDAAQTALLVGLLRGLATTIVARTDSHLSFDGIQPSIRIHPRFNQTVLDTTLVCIFKTRLGHIMSASLRTFGEITSSYFRGGGYSV